MHDELVKRLRECASGECFNCSQYQETTNASVCSKELLHEAADAIEELQRLVEANKTFNWIPVTERLPETDDDVVVAFKNSKDGEWWYRIDNFVDGAFCYNAAFGRNITHWMPLPEPPKEE